MVYLNNEFCKPNNYYTLTQYKITYNPDRLEFDFTILMNDHNIKNV